MTTPHINPHVNTDRHIPQLIPHRLLRGGQTHHPAVLEEAKRRSEKIRLRLADRITAFAGSMNFVAARRPVRRLDDIGREEPGADLDSRGVPESDLPVDVRHDRPEPPSRFPAGKGRSRILSTGTGT